MSAASYARAEPGVPKNVGRALVVVVGIGLLGLLIGFPWVVGAVLANRAQVVLMRPPACRTAQTFCPEELVPVTASDRNRSELQRLSAWLTVASTWGPPMGSVDRALLAVDFALGNRQGAAKAFARLQRGSKPAGAPFDRGFAGYLLRAHLAADRGDWVAATQLYRVGLTMAPTQSLETDEHDLLVALAMANRHAADTGGDPARSAFLVGKMLIRAGYWAEGEQWLQTARQTPSFGGGSAVDLGWLELYRGIALDKLGRLDQAAQAYRSAMQAAPARAEPYVRSIELAKRQGTAADPALVAALDRTQPMYVLGRQGTDGASRVERPANLGDGWRVLGYDVDDETLEDGRSVDLLVWWQGSEGRVPSGEGWVQSGTRWLQRQRVTNLATNAGFEWGLGSNGLPVGFADEFYARAKARIATTVAERAGRQTTVLELLNDGRPDIGAIGLRVPVVPDGVYLEAGWLRDPAGNANIGRLCRQDEGDDSPTYISQEARDETTRQGWTHWAGAGPPSLQVDATSCAPFLLNYHSDRRAQFDNVLFARLQRP